MNIVACGPCDRPIDAPEETTAHALIVATDIRRLAQTSVAREEVQP
jgi:hypothetical protein